MKLLINPDHTFGGFELSKGSIAVFALDACRLHGSFGCVVLRGNLLAVKEGQQVVLMPEKTFPGPLGLAVLAGPLQHGRRPPRQLRPSGDIASFPHRSTASLQLDDLCFYPQGRGQSPTPPFPAC